VAPAVLSLANMYQEFCGLRELPFELTANPRYLFLTDRQREALSVLQYGLVSAKSLTLLVGEAGTGKTTLLRTALDSDRCSNVQAVYLNNPMLSGADFVALLALRFDLGPAASASKSVLLEQLEARLLERRAAGIVTALVVDEAQSLSTELLEEIRLLANIETPDGKLLPLVLAGQPELAERLEQPELRQLKQRVALRCELTPFALDDTAAYIASRIRTAGGAPARLFTQEAVSLIHYRSSGIPRTVNVVCDNALVGAMALRTLPVDRALVDEVCGDLRLSGTATAEPHAVSSPWQTAATPEPEAGDNNGDSEDPAPPPQSSKFGFRFAWRRPAPLRSTRIATE
jgi:general secretion pathway protein A